MKNLALILGGLLTCCLCAKAQQYIYTYTGNDFTSVFNGANELFYGIVPYTTSDKITGSMTFSAPLGANYNGNPSATLLSFNFTDDVGPQNIGGTQAVFPYVGVFTFGTDSSGNIVSWNFQVTAFINSTPAETKGIQTENEPGNVMDSGNLDQASGIVGQGSVSADPGAWAETIVIVPEPADCALFLGGAVILIVFKKRTPIKAC